MEIATGIPWISINADLSRVEKSNNIVVKKVTTGRNNILSKLSFRASLMFVYFLP